MESFLRQRFSEVLGRSDIAPDDDFFELGGDSLATVEIAAALEQHLGVPVPPTILFEFPTIRALMQRLDPLTRPAAIFGQGPRPPGA
jgi:acyl carrier protein